MPAIRKVGEGIRIERPSGRKRITLDTRNLNKTTNRIASQAQMMLQSHLGGILNLGRRSSKQLARRSGRHRTSDTDLTLTTDLRS